MQDDNLAVFIMPVHQTVHSQLPMKGLPIEGVPEVKRSSKHLASLQNFKVEVMALLMESMQMIGYIHNGVINLI